MLIIAEPKNQLANRLFNLGHVIATAIDAKTCVLNPGFEDYARFYTSMADDGLCRFPARALPLWRVPSTDRARYVEMFRRISNSLVSGKLHRLHGRRIRVFRSSEFSPLDARFDGYVEMGEPAFAKLARSCSFLFLSGPLFRNDDAFVRHAGRIREYLTPHAHHLKAAQDSVAIARALGEVVVAVHVRHGDYATYADGRYFYSFDVYRSLMDQVSALHAGRKVAFLVCSNTPPPAGIFGEHPVVNGPGEIIEDLHAMALTDAIIGPPSTFSAWASFYGKVPLCVVHDPKRRIEAKDFYPVQSHCTRLPPADERDHT